MFVCVTGLSAAAALVTQLFGSVTVAFSIDGITISQLASPDAQAAIVNTTEAAVSAIVTVGEPPLVAITAITARFSACEYSVRLHLCLQMCSV